MRVRVQLVAPNADRGGSASRSAPNRAFSIPGCEDIELLGSCQQTYEASLGISDLLR